MAGKMIAFCGLACTECDAYRATRACGRERGVENCARCAGYPCAQLERFFAMAPIARAALEALRGG